MPKPSNSLDSTNSPDSSVSQNVLHSFIQTAKGEFFQTSWIFLYWGIIGMLIPAIILIMRSPSVNLTAWANYPLLGFPVAGILSTVLIIRHSLRNPSNNFFTFLLSFLWSVVSVNIFFLAFAIPSIYNQLLVPTVFLLIAVAQTTTGLLLKVKSLSITGLAINIMVIAYWIFLSKMKTNQLGSDNEMIFLILLAFIGQLIPGLFIRRLIKHEKYNHLQP